MAAARANPGVAKAAAAAAMVLALLAGLRVSPVIAAVLVVCLVMLGVAFRLATYVLAKDEGTADMQEVGACWGGFAIVLLPRYAQHASEQLAAAALLWGAALPRHDATQAALGVAAFAGCQCDAPTACPLSKCRSLKPSGTARKATLPPR